MDLLHFPTRPEMVEPSNGPLNEALQKVLAFRFLDPALGPDPSVGLPGASGGLPEAPGT